MRSVQWTGNVVLGVVLAILAALAATWLVQAQVREVMGFGLPARTYPRVVLALTAVSGLAIALESLLRRVPEDVEGEPLEERRLRQVGNVLATVVAYTAMLPVVGFLVATPLLLVVLLRIFGERSWLGLAGVAILVPLAIFGLFTKLLHLVLP